MKIELMSIIIIFVRDSLRYFHIYQCNKTLTSPIFSAQPSCPDMDYVILFFVLSYLSDGVFLLDLNIGNLILQLHSMSIN